MTEAMKQALVVEFFIMVQLPQQRQEKQQERKNTLQVKWYILCSVVIHIIDEADSIQSCRLKFKIVKAFQLIQATDLKYMTHSAINPSGIPAFKI